MVLHVDYIRGVAMPEEIRVGNRDTLHFNKTVFQSHSFYLPPKN